MKKSSLKATSIRTTLSFSLFIMLLIFTVGFYFVQGWLNSLATDIGRTVFESTGSSENLTIKQLQTDLDNNKLAADKASGMIASSQAYKTQIVEDLNKYASNNGITIASYSLEQSPANGASIPAINGLSSSYITITLANPIQYTNLMQFFKSIESNLPKMQITGVNMRMDSTSSNAVTIDPITIGVYTR